MRGSIRAHNSGPAISTISVLYYKIGILDTDNFVWSRLRVSGTPPTPRYSHSANISGPDIVFFGGWTLTSGDRGYGYLRKRVKLHSIVRY